jgi:NADH-quinone oxidoreductase subunit J
VVTQNIAFAIIAAAMVVAAVAVVTVRNVVHAALSLVVVLAGAAAQYLLLQAEFVGIVQILVYIGAVLVLFLFGIMLTRDPMVRKEDLDNNLRLPAIAVCMLLLAVLVSLFTDTFTDTEITSAAQPTSTGEVAEVIFRDYVVAFEVVSVLLLAALVGSIVIARRD